MKTKSKALKGRKMIARGEAPGTTATHLHPSPAQSGEARAYSHTPGPWAIETDVTMDGSRLNIISGDRVGYYLIASCDGESCGVPDCGEAESNSRLIAAAPEMLQAGIELLSCLDNLTTEKFSQGGDRPFREQLRAAIAIARGETPGQGS